MLEQVNLIAKLVQDGVRKHNPIDCRAVSVEEHLDASTRRQPDRPPIEEHDPDPDSVAPVGKGTLAPVRPNWQGETTSPGTESCGDHTVGGGGVGRLGGSGGLLGGGRLGGADGGILPVGRHGMIRDVESHARSQLPNMYFPR